MDITSSTIKYVLFVCNFCFVMFGLFMVIVGCINAFSNDEATKILEYHDYTIIGVFLIFIGLCIFSVTFFGCWGAFYEKYSMLYVYGILLSVLLLLQLIFYGIALYFCNKDSNGQFVKRSVEKFFEKYYSHQIQDQQFKQIIDRIQAKYSCCGVDGPDFWKNHFHKKNQIPASCCYNSVCDSRNIYQKGCLDDIKEYLSSKFYLSYIIWSLIIQILVIGSTFYLAKELRTDRSDYDAI